MKLFATLGALFLTGVVSATPIRNIVVFGDSLSDNGNLYEVMKHQLPTSPPYYLGRFSNGPVWVEQLAATYFPTNPTAHLLDYAIGGAGIAAQDSQNDDNVDGVLNHLKKEILTYLVAHNNRASEDSLYIIWIGANNYLGLPPEVEQTLQTVNKGIVTSLKRLADHGAKHILVLNLPDLGRTPAAREFDSVAAFSYFADAHNQRLNESMQELKNNNPDVNWIFYDMNVIFKDLTDNPEKYGFKNVTQPCNKPEQSEHANLSMLSIASHTMPQGAADKCDGYLYFDLVHPTFFAHQVMAEKAKEVLDELGFEFVE